MPSCWLALAAKAKDVVTRTLVGPTGAFNDCFVTFA